MKLTGHPPAIRDQGHSTLLPTVRLVTALPWYRTGQIDPFSGEEERDRLPIDSCKVFSDDAAFRIR